MADLTIQYITAAGGAGAITFSDTTPATSQQALIQGCLTDVANAGGGAVTLSGGIFTVAPQTIIDGIGGILRIGSNTTLSGAADGSSVIKLADGYNGTVTGILSTDSGRTLPDGSFQTTHDVHIENLTIDGNKANNTSGNVDGFYCGPRPNSGQADDQISLDHVTIRDCSRYGFDPHEQTTNLAFTNCTATGNVDGFTIDGCSYVLIADCVSSGNSRHGFNIVTGSHDVELTNNIANGNGASGIVIQTGNNEIRDWTHNIAVNGGVVSGNGTTGISVRQADGVVITGVDLSGQTTVPRLLVEGCRPDPDSQSSISVDVFGCLGPNAEPLTLANGLAVRNYNQSFGTADAADDRYIVSTGVRFGADTISATTINLTGTDTWTYIIHDDPAFEDVFNGSAADDRVAAGAGDDQLNGGIGTDWLYGGDGDDTLYGGDGDDADPTAGATALQGNAGNDTIFGDAGNDELDGGAGNDLLAGGAGDDAIMGGLGQDRIDFSDAASGLLFQLSSSGEGSVDFSAAGLGRDSYSSIEGATGGAFDDVLVGNELVNVLVGLGGNDSLIGGGGADQLSGGDGNDVLWFDSFDTKLEGGTGFDHLIQTDAAALSIALADLGVEVVVASGGNDRLDGSGVATSMVIYGGAGNDTLTIGAAGGYLFGQDGADVLAGASGVDILIGGAGADSFQAGGGGDVLYIDAADGNGFDGGDGGDYAIVDGMDAVNVSLNGRNIEVFLGNAGDDIIDASGTMASMALYGGNGADAITAGDGSTILFGEAGADHLAGGAAGDILIGGDGADVLSGGGGDDVLYVDSADVSVDGGLGIDTLIVDGATGVDLSIGGASIEVAVGNSGNDVIDATGAAISVTLYGNDGDDTLTGGGANDLFFGGAGSDTFHFGASSAADTIYDFDASEVGGQDYIDVGGRGFSAVSIGNEITIGSSGANTLITIGADTVLLIGIASGDVTAGSFLF